MKTMSIKISIGFVVILLGVQLAFAQTSKQNIHTQTSDPCNNLVEYDKVISNLFPHYFLGSGDAHTMFLSYTPPNEPEMQISILFSKPGKSEIYLYKSIDRSILLQLQDIQKKNCNASYSEIIKQIKFRKTRVNLTENELLEIRTGFSDTVKNSINYENRNFENVDSDLVTIILDSPSYEVSYSGLGNITLSGAGNPIDSKPLKDEPPFIEWMREVYRIIISKDRSH